MRYTLLLILVFCSILVSKGQDFDAEVLKFITNITVNNKKLVKDIYCEIQINNRDGEEYNEVIIPHSPLSKVSKIKAFVKNKNGIIVRKLKNNEINESSAYSISTFYQDYLFKNFSLRNNSFPYTLVYSYRITEKQFVYIDYWTPVLHNQLPVKYAQLTIKTAKNYQLNYLTENKINFFKKIDKEKSLEYVWEASYTNIIKQEEFSSDITQFYPTVRVVPINLKFENEASFDTWINLGNWQNSLLHNLDYLNDNEKFKISAIVKDLKTKEEKIKALYHYLQDETRYVNVSIKTGGLKPYPANYVALNKYGDCKALTNYFKAILKFIGIESFYVKINAGDKIKEIKKQFPSQQSNHAILFIPFKNKDLWIDCTSKSAFNYVGTFIQNRSAFIIKKDSSYFKQTPKLKEQDVLEKRLIIVEQMGSKQQVNYNNLYKGDKYELLQSLENNYTNKEREEFIVNTILAKKINNVKYKIISKSRDKASLNLQLEGSCNTIYKKYGNELVVSTISFNLPKIKKVAKRKQPIQIDYPINLKDSIIYKLPKGFIYKSNFQDLILKSKFGTYTFNVKSIDNKIIIGKCLILNSGKYSLKDYKDFYQFYSKVYKNEKLCFVLTPIKI